MLDEKALRRADFIGGTPIELADGQEWVIPFVDTYFTIDDGEVGARQEWNMGPEYDALYESFESTRRALQDGEGDINDKLLRLMGREMALCRWLLLRNYQLTDAEVSTLIRFGLGDKEKSPYAALRDRMMECALGNIEAPKAVAV